MYAIRSYYGYKRERVKWGETTVEILRNEIDGKEAAAWHLVYDVARHAWEAETAAAWRARSAAQEASYNFV